jgi:hypothetical protein
MISAAAFRAVAPAFAALWNEQNGGEASVGGVWDVRTRPPRGGGGGEPTTVLAYEGPFALPPYLHSEPNSLASVSPPLAEEDDDAACSSSGGGGGGGRAAAGRLRAHVLHHASYGTPVLLLRLERADGAALPHEACLAALPALAGAAADAAAADAAGAPPLPALSQEHHPLDGLPWLQLHPCNTPAVMALLMQREGDEPDGGGGESLVAGERALPYLAAWFSLAAPLVGLPPLRLASV